VPKILAEADNPVGTREIDMRASAIVSSVLLLALFSWPVVAEELELIGDRPDFTESNAAVPVDHLQAEFGVEAAGAEDSLEIALPKLLLRYGLERDFELRLEVPDLVMVKPDGGDLDFGAGALAVGFKWVHPIGNAAAAGVILMGGAPAAADDREVEGFFTSVNGLWGVDLSDRLALGGNFRLDVERLGADEASGDTVATFTASLALGVALTDRLGAFAEAIQEVAEGDEYTTLADAGLTFLVTPHVQLDAYGGADVTDPGGAWFAGTGAIVLF